MNCECGKEMKELDNQYGRDYCSTTFYCYACDAFYKDEVIKIEQFRKIDDEREIEDLRERLDDE